MKPKLNPFLTRALSVVLSLSFADSVSAADYFWDFNGAAANTGGAGNWSTANTWRDGSATGTLGNWVDGNTAILGGTAGAVTIGSGVTITTPRINVTANNYSLSGGTVAFGGTAENPGIVDVNGTATFAFSSGATGSLRVMATGSTVSLANSAPMIITGSTNLSTFELAMNQDQNHLILGNAAALGGNSATVKLTKGTLNLGNTSGVNLSYNSWSTELAGGTIRARFALQTWNGATSVTANSQLMTRNASDAKLTFSSTGTINLNSNSLTLMSSSSSQGIELNGIISGAGNLVTGSNPFGGSDNGNGVTTLNAANTFTGNLTTTQNIGTVALGNVNALQNATLNTGVSGTQAVTFVVAGNNTYNIGALAGADALAIGGNTISLGNKAGSYSFGADISGTGGLTKAGATSTQTLTANTSFTGATNVTGGTFALTGSGAVNSSSGITVNGSDAKFLHNGSTAVSSAVTLTNGTVTGNGVINSVSVGNGTGGIITNNDGVAGSALTIGTLALTGAANINLFSNSTSTALVVTNSLSTGSTAATITANSTGGWTNGTTYDLISYGGGSVGGSGNNFTQVVNNLSARQSAIWNDTGSLIQITINGDTPRWMGDTDGKWNLTTANNWKLVTGGGYTNFLAVDDVLFDDNASGTTTIDIDSAHVSPNTTQFNNSNENYTLTGAFGIASGTLTKNGTGTLTIGTNNSYTGATKLNAGAVILSGVGTIGSGSTLTMAGASLDLGGSVQNTGAVSISAASASGDTVSNGSINGSSYAVSNTSGDVGISARLLANGAAGLTKTGAGSLTLAGLNTWTGATQLNGGSVTISGSGTLGNAAALNMGGGSLNLGGTSQTVGAVTVSSAASAGDTVSNGSLTGTSYATSHSAGNAVISANLLVNGSAGFSMSGGGDVTLSGANTYTGATTVDAGTLFVGSAQAFTDKGALVMTGTSVFNLSGNQATVRNLTTAAGNSITTSGTGTGTDVLTISAMSASSGALFTDGTTRKLGLTITGTGTVDPLSNANNTFSGGLSLTNARLSVVDNSAITGGRYGTGVITIGTGAQMYYNAANRTVSNDIVVNANSTVGSRTGAFRVDTAGNVLSGTITANGADAMFNAGNGNGGITVTGKITGNSGLQARNTNGTSLTLTLSNVSGDNDYSGNTLIGETTARIVLGASNQIANGLGKGNLTATGTLDLAGFNETINGLSGAGIIEGATTGTATNTFTLGDGDVTGLNFSGAIQNTAGTLSVTKIGTGTQILSGTNTYTGATLISAGTLQIGNGGATGTLSSSSAITNNGTLAFNRTGTVTQGTDFAAGIGGSGGLTTIGAGTLILSGTNGYSGATVVSNGELRVTSASAISGTSDITVNSGRFSLDGSITTGSGKSITINGSGANFFGALQGSGGNNVWEGDVVIGATAGTRIGVNVGSLRVAGAISGSTALNGITLRPNTGTVLELSGANTYAGDTTIISGTGMVTLSGGSDRLPTGTRLIFGGSGTSGTLDLNGQNQQIAGLSVNSGTTNEIRSASAAVLTVNTAAASSSSWGGLISGSISLTKSGSDTLTLTSANTYTGTTNVNQGTLALTGTGSIANSGRIHLAGTTTLDVRGLAGGFTLGASQSLTGIGTIMADGKTVTMAGTLSPGNSPGTLSQNGGVMELAANGQMNWQVYDAAGIAGTGYDTVSLTNGATLSLAALTALNPYQINLWTLAGINTDVNGDAINFDAMMDYSWTLFSTENEISNFDQSLFQINLGASNGTSGFSNALNGGSFSVALTDSNTDLVLRFTAVPETSVTLLGGLSALLLLRRRRA